MIAKEYEDQNILKIKETHNLLDKIEERVKSFIRKDDGNIQKSLSFQLTPSAQKFKIENKNITIDQSIDQIKNLDQSSQFYLLKEIKDIDNAYKTEIDYLKAQIQQMQKTIDQYQQSQLQDKQQMDQKNNIIARLSEQVDYLQSQNQALKEENKLLINEVAILNNQMRDNSSRMNRTISVNKIGELHKELQEERNKSENLKYEIQKIKEKIEESQKSNKKTNYKANDNLKQIIHHQQSLSHSNFQNKSINRSFNKENQGSIMNCSNDNFEKTLKRIEQAQEKQAEYNQYFMNCVKELQQSQSKIDSRQLDYYPTKEHCKRSLDSRRQIKRTAFKIPLRPNLL